MDVRLPDGTVISGVPDNITKAELSAKLKANGYNIDAPAEPKEAPGVFGQAVKDFAAGAVRGAGSIGATLLAPVDAGARALGVQNDFIGRTDRREAMDASLRDNFGADPESIAYGVGKVGAEIAGTAGAGGAVANAARLIPGAARAAPLLDAVASGGMRAGGLTGGSAQVARAAGGAISGGLQAGLVNPEDAGTGALIGGAAPAALQAAGAVGRAAGNVLRGPQASPELLTAAQQARTAGYVMPPTQVQPTLINRLLEGFSGKITTAQNASARNQTVTNRLAAEAVGLPGDVPLTPDALNAVREQASKAYRALAALPEVPPVQGSSVMNRPAVAGFSPRQALEELKQARNDATAWFTAAGRSASPDDLKKAKSYAATAAALEKQFETYAASIGRNDLVPDMQEARKLIAKTYTLEKALNPTTGSVDAKKLGAMVTKGKPLSGGLRDAGEFANRFPKAAQTPEAMGSLPQTSPLDWSLAALMSAGTSNPLALASVAARPLTRNAILSGPMQNRMVQPGQNRLMTLADQIPVQELLTRGAPVIAAQ